MKSIHDCKTEVGDWIRAGVIYLWERLIRSGRFVGVDNMDTCYIQIRKMET